MPSAAELMALGEMIGVKSTKPRLPPKVQDRMGLDTTGLAALANQRATHWPQDAGEISEQPGVPMAPRTARESGFIDPAFVGPMPGSEQWNLPAHMRGSILRGMMDTSGPMAEDEYQYWLNSLVKKARPL
jgi:hypothetical protein